MSIYDAVDLVAETIGTETGLRSVADPRQIVLPCVLVNPPRLEFNILGGTGAEAEITVMLLTPGPYNADSLRSLAEMLDSVLAVRGIVQPESAEPVQYTTSDGSKVPGYQLTYRMVVNR